ncbi:hypothetical protein PVAP13_3NG212071 [Panicum virgatum]|uniref:Uncharacterized protein n=1 Tax=Panicum virgatum TaxID=38727 RepID=A0A8T0UEW0_PANVG|nr:hypothetical protein PVAP13_3NG212071 [Panicum virgatum]
MSFTSPDRQVQLRIVVEFHVTKGIIIKIWAHTVCTIKLCSYGGITNSSGQGR